MRQTVAVGVIKGIQRTAPGKKGEVPGKAAGKKA